ncbi:MAG: MarR family winged helix-turn-helix transcriptional regulator [Pusillimonas sp.]
MNAHEKIRATPPIDQTFLLSLLGYNCLQAYLKVTPPIKRLLAKHKLKPVEFTVLALVAENPQINQKRIGETINVSPPNLATLLDRMQHDGLLERQRNPRDKRSHIVALTAQGQAVYEKTRINVANLDKPATLNADEHDQLIQLLQKVFL